MLCMPSVYSWFDDDGRAHEVCQAEGGEQGDPLMPAFYALAQHAALADLQSQLVNGEAIFAFLDDVYVVSAPERVRTLYDALAATLWHRARIRLHEGKTRIWNSAGEERSNIADMSGDDGAEPVWVGDWSLPPKCQGITVLGSPLDRLLQRLPSLDDLQAAWLLLYNPAPPRVPTTCCASCPPTSLPLYMQEHTMQPSPTASSTKPPPCRITASALPSRAAVSWPPLCHLRSLCRALGLVVRHLARRPCPCPSCGGPAAWCPSRRQRRSRRPCAGASARSPL